MHRHLKCLRLKQNSNTFLFLGLPGFSCPASCGLVNRPEQNSGPCLAIVSTLGGDGNVCVGEGYMNATLRSPFSSTPSTPSSWIQVWLRLSFNPSTRTLQRSSKASSCSYPCFISAILSTISGFQSDQVAESRSKTSECASARAILPA